VTTTKKTIKEKKDVRRKAYTRRMHHYPEKKNETLENTEFCYEYFA